MSANAECRQIEFETTAMDHYFERRNVFAAVAEMAPHARTLLSWLGEAPRDEVDEPASLVSRASEFPAAQEDIAGGSQGQSSVAACANASTGANSPHRADDETPRARRERLWKRCEELNLSGMKTWKSTAALEGGYRDSACTC
jgi:hypothetical protein